MSFFTNATFDSLSILLPGKDYDEFRNFVSVSQLKPTSGQDVSSLFSGASGTAPTGSVRSTKRQEGGDEGTIGGFDDIIQKRKDASTNETMTQILPNNFQTISLGRPQKEKANNSTGSSMRAKSNVKTSKSSRAAYDFLRGWKQHCKSAKETLSFLSRTEDVDSEGTLEDRLILQPDAVCKEYFSTDIDSDILGGIVEALHLLVYTLKHQEDSTAATAEENGSSETSGVSQLLSCQTNALSFTQSWLKALTTCGRFDLSVSFLMPNEQMKLKEVCNFLKSNKVTGDNVDYLRRCDSLLK